MKSILILVLSLSFFYCNAQDSTFGEKKDPKYLKARVLTGKLHHKADSIKTLYDKLLPNADTAFNRLARYKKTEQQDSASKYLTLYAGYVKKLAVWKTQSNNEHYIYCKLLKKFNQKYRVIEFVDDRPLIYDKQ